MANLIERSILLTIGAAALTLDMAESLAGEMVKRGQETSEESRKAMDELLERARGEAMSFRGDIDSGIRNLLSEAGVPSREQLSELELKLAQLEHRISLLEDGGSGAGDAPGGSGGGEKTKG
jgi:polyhydroxyalkanoate synthesis regulator phasin